jgi:hypothetical protein
VTVLFLAELPFRTSRRLPRLLLLLLHEKRHSMRRENK